VLKSILSLEHSYQRSPERSLSRDKQSYDARRFARKPSWPDYDDDDKLRDARMQSVTTTVTSTSSSTHPFSRPIDAHNYQGTFFNRNQPPASISYSGSTDLAPVASHMPHDPSCGRAISMEGDPHDAPPILESCSTYPHSQSAQDGGSVL
jgi:hypothetical protein